MQSSLRGLNTSTVEHTPSLFQRPANTFNSFKLSVATSPNPHDPQRPQVPKILNSPRFRVSACNAAFSPVSSFPSRRLCPFRHSMLLYSCRSLCELYLFSTFFGRRAMLYSACPAAYYGNFKAARYAVTKPCRVKNLCRPHKVCEDCNIGGCM